jgi:plasmid stabilization system protein ParE
VIQLKWTSKALADLVQLHEFLALVNKPAAARTVQALSDAPNSLLANPRIGEALEEFAPREVRRISTRCVTKFMIPPSMCCVSGIRARIAR